MGEPEPVERASGANDAQQLVRVAPEVFHVAAAPFFSSSSLDPAEAAQERGASPSHAGSRVTEGSGYATKKFGSPMLSRQIPRTVTVMRSASRSSASIPQISPGLRPHPRARPMAAAECPDPHVASARAALRPAGGIGRFFLGGRGTSNGTSENGLEAHSPSASACLPAAAQMVLSR